MLSSMKPKKKDQLMKLLDARMGDLILLAVGKQSLANQNIDG
jgi:aspartyl-tRNA synthetase